MDDKPIFSFFPPTICAYFRLGQLIRVEESFPRVMVSAKPDDLFTVIDRFKQEHVLQYAGVVDPVGQVHVFGFPGQLSSDGPARVFCFDVDSEDLLEWIEPEEKLKIMKVYEDCIKKQAGPFRCHVL